MVRIKIEVIFFYILFSISIYLTMLTIKIPTIKNYPINVDYRVFHVSNMIIKPREIVKPSYSAPFLDYNDPRHSQK